MGKSNKNKNKQQPAASSPAAPPKAPEQQQKVVSVTPSVDPTVKPGTTADNQFAKAPPSSTKVADETVPAKQDPNHVPSPPSPPAISYSGAVKSQKGPVKVNSNEQVSKNEKNTNATSDPAAKVSDTPGPIEEKKNGTDPIKLKKGDLPGAKDTSKDLKDGPLKPERKSEPASKLVTSVPDGAKATVPVQPEQATSESKVTSSEKSKSTEAPPAPSQGKKKQKQKKTDKEDTDPEKLPPAKNITGNKSLNLPEPTSNPTGATETPPKPDKITAASKEQPKSAISDQMCPICNKEANSRCGGCNSVYYCSREHQKQHWKRGHKASCVAWKICTSANLGRYLVATRDIEPGEVIIQERPLLLTPPKLTSPVCLSCYHELLPFDEAGTSAADDEEIKPVSCVNKCGWPLCSAPSCKETRDHHAPECKAACDRGGVAIKNFGQDHPMYQAVGILRSLALKEQKPADFDNFMKLQSSHDATKEITDQAPAAFPDLGMTVKLILDFFQYSKKGVTEEMVRKISGIIDLNGHEIPIPGNYGQINRRLIGVYHISSFLEHNCRPNCTKTWDTASSSHSIVIRSAIKIKKGEHLSISYVDPLWGTNDRQHFLQVTKFFTCNCSRCTDPTELGCHISSFRCQQIQCSTKAEAEEKSFVPINKRSGMIVPLDPLNPEAAWHCLTCKEKYPVKYASSIIDKISSDMEKFQENRGDIAASEDFIKKLSKILPPYHFFLLEMKVELAQLYGRTPEEPLPALAPVKLLRKKYLCEEILLALNVILPGLNRLRALILYELQAASGTLSKIKASVGEISAETHFLELQKCRSQLAEAATVLSWEPKLSVEYRRCEGAKRELADLSETLAECYISDEEPSPAIPSMRITERNAQAENVIPVDLSRDSIDKLAAQSQLNDDLELF